MTDSTNNLLLALLSPAGPRAAAAEARTKGTCIRCEKPPVLRSDLERREYAISALCGPCWDEMFPPEEEGD